MDLDSGDRLREYAEATRGAAEAYRILPPEEKRRRDMNRRRISSRVVYRIRQGEEAFQREIENQRYRG